MNTVEFRVESTELGIGRRDVVNVHVDGTLLQDLVRPVEQPFADAEGKAGLAGSYEGLANPELLVKDHFLRSPQVLWHGDPMLLGCVCGDGGCWPLTARIEVGADRVRWSGFRTGHRPWDLSAFGPFEFDRAAYEAALATAIEVSRRSRR